MSIDILKSYSFRGFTLFDYSRMSGHDPDLFYNKVEMLDYAMGVLSGSVLANFRATIRMKYSFNFNSTLRVIFKSIDYSLRKGNGSVTFMSKYKFKEMIDSYRVAKTYLDNFAPNYLEFTRLSIVDRDKAMVKKLNKLYDDLLRAYKADTRDKWEYYHLLKNLMNHCVRFRYMNRIHVKKFVRLIMKLDEEYIQRYMDSLKYEHDLITYKEFLEETTDKEKYEFYKSENLLKFSLNTSVMYIADPNRLEEICKVYHDKFVEDYKNGVINEATFSRASAILAESRTLLSYSEPKFYYSCHTPLLMYFYLEGQYDKDLKQLLFTRNELLNAIELAEITVETFNEVKLKEFIVSWLDTILDRTQESSGDELYKAITDFEAYTLSAYEYGIITKDEKDEFLSNVNQLGDE